MTFRSHALATVQAGASKPSPEAAAHYCALGDFHVDGMDNIAEGRDKTARRAHGPQPENSMALAGVEFVSGVYPGRRFHRLTGHRIFVLHGSVPMAIKDFKIAPAVS
jgi:hypothetical protein